MKPDDAMPFFGTAFFEATEGYTDAVITGYLRALWHYWNHTHCQGLPDDDDYLRRICHCDPANWARTRGVIFDNQFFFCKNGNHWHQKKARELHSKELELYQRRVTWAENARQQKAQSSTNAGVKADISPSVLRISQEKELERVSQRIRDILAAGTQVAGAQMTYTTPQRAELKALKDRREQLKKELGFIA